MATDDLISALASCGTNCPDKSILNAEERLREASDILKGCLSGAGERLDK